MRLEAFLERKPLYYSEIDYTRMPRAYASIKEKIKIPPIIHVVGTNGKGTTGRYIANALHTLGIKVGHYTSPHIKEFNERIWLNGVNCDYDVLERAHERLQKLLSEDFKKSLSYFEYTTFLAILVYENCDYIVLEAGLGGEYDATNAFEKVISVITPIGMDHEDFLGSSIKEIAETKLRSVSNKAIVAKQVFSEVEDVIKELSTSPDLEFKNYKTCVDDTMLKLAQEISQEQELPHYLQENLLLSMCVVKELGYKVKKNLFNSQRLEGRMQRIKSNIWLDVGHNALAAEAISHCFRAKSVNLVYNSYKDKDYLSILALLAPIVKRVEIIPVNDDRIAPYGDMVDAIVRNNLEYKMFDKIIDDEDYLVFGSFSVAQKFKTLLG